MAKIKKGFFPPPAFPRSKKFNRVKVALDKRPKRQKKRTIRPADSTFFRCPSGTTEIQSFCRRSPLPAFQQLSLIERERHATLDDEGVLPDRTRITSKRRRRRG